MDIAWKPTEKQKEALCRVEFEILFGGARGGGKTDAGIVFPLYHIQAPDFRGLVIRRNAEDLKDWLDRAEIMYRNLGAKRTGNPATFEFPRGAKIRTGHLKDENAYTKYQGHEYQNMQIEELTQIPTETSYLKLLASCRSTIEGISPQIFCTTNPGGIGHKWVKKRFIDPMSIGTPYIDPVSGRARIFIPAKVEDNPHLMDRDPDYVRFLDSLPEGLRQQWRDGSWSDYEIEGAYYTTQVRESNTKGRIGFVPYDPGLVVNTVWDLGRNSDAMAIWFYQIRGQQINFIDYVQGEFEPIQYYIRLLQEKKYVYGDHFAPHDIEVTELTRKTSRKEVARKLGINFKVVPKTNIQDGIDRAKILFGRCFFDAINCEQGLDCLRNYRKEWDSKANSWKPNPQKSEFNHGADAFRYFAVAFSEERPQSIQSNKPAWWDRKTEYADSKRKRLINPAAGY